jgi:hypothetical protein
VHNTHQKCPRSRCRCSHRCSSREFAWEEACYQYSGGQGESQSRPPCADWLLLIRSHPPDDPTGADETDIPDRLYCTRRSWDELYCARRSWDELFGLCAPVRGDISLRIVIRGGRTRGGPTLTTLAASAIYKGFVRI